MIHALLLLSVLAGNPLVHEQTIVSPETVAGARWELSDAAEQPSLVPDPDRPAERVIRLPYALTEETPRASWDVALPSGLAGLASFRCEVWIDRPDLLRGLTVYFHSAPGWYGAWLSAATADGKPGWKTLVWTRAEMNAENPGPWGGADKVRFSAWQAGTGSGALLLRPVVASGSPIQIVTPRWWIAQDPSREDEVKPWLESMGEYLTKAGIPFGATDDTDLDPGALAETRLLLFPYAPALSPDLLERLPDYVAGGGRVIGCYTMPHELDQMLGVLNGEYVRNSEGESRFARIVFGPDALPGLGASVGQNSWNAVVPTELGPEAQTLGLWQAADGTLGGPACVLSPAGAWFGHVLTEADAQGKADLLLALIGHFVPEAWEAAVASRRESLGRIGPFATTEALAESIRASGNAEAGELLDQTLAKLDEADSEAAAKHWPEAIRLLSPLGGEFTRAWAKSLAPKPGEFRAVWCHSAFGVGEWGWDKSLDVLKAAGFTAVIPNMLWAGIAYYPSEVLPVATEIATRGDQIAQCVEAAHARGLEVHVWMVNWCLGNAPEEFLDKLRTEGRLQIDPRGEEVSGPYLWLCPSDDRNYALVRDAMVEVAAKYAVDGLHFDYIRYPGLEGCYCPRCREAFEAELGHPVAEWPKDVLGGGALLDEWYEFRRTRIDRVVGAVATQARAVHPGIKISAAVFGDLPHSRDTVGQDWDRWIERGWLDFVCPMDYTDDLAGFRNLVTKQREWVGGRVPLYPGIGAYRMGPDGLLAQILATRELGADGFTVFNLDQSLAEDYLPLCAEGLTRE